MVQWHFICRISTCAVKFFLHVYTCGRRHSQSPKSCPPRRSVYWSSSPSRKVPGSCRAFLRRPRWATFLAIPFTDVAWPAKFFQQFFFCSRFQPPQSCTWCSFSEMIPLLRPRFIKLIAGKVFVTVVQRPLELTHLISSLQVVEQQPPHQSLGPSEAAGGVSGDRRPKGGCR